MDHEFLHQRRIELGLSQSNVAEKLGYSTQTISLWENGKGAPNLPIWGKLAALYEVDLEGLLTNQAKKESLLCEEKEFDPQNFASCLKKLRKREGLTQAELAKSIGIPANAVLRFEQGTSFPSEEQFKKLAEIYGLSFDELYFGLLPPVGIKNGSAGKDKPFSTRLVAIIAIVCLLVVGGGIGVYFGLNQKGAPARSDSSQSGLTTSADSSSAIPSSESFPSSSEEPSSSSVPSAPSSESLDSSSASSEESASSSAQQSESSEPSSSQEVSSSEEPSSLSSESSFSSEESSEEISSSDPSSEESSSSLIPISYTVDFDLDGGTSPSYVGPVSVADLDEAFFYDVSKENHSFKGWLYQDEWIIDENAVYQKEIELVSDMVFKAKWEEILYPVNYVLDGGTNSDSNPSSIAFGETVVLADASKAGYLFEGWYLDSGFVTAVAALSGSEAKELGSVTLYAKFTYNTRDPYNYPYLTFIKLSGGRARVKYSGSGLSKETLLLPDEITLEGVHCVVSEIEDEGFAGLSSISSITFPAHLEHIGARAFEGCSSLTNAKLLSEESLDIGDRAFASCSSLQFVKIGICVYSIGDDAFKNGHDNLVFLLEAGYDDTLGTAWNPDHKPVVPFAAGMGYQVVGGVKYMKMSVSSTYAYCAFGATASSVHVASEIGGTPVWMIAENAFYKSGLSSCDLPINLMIIASYAFAYCASLSTIYIPESVDTILDYAFYKATGLTIRCQASSKPDGWSSLWNASGLPVLWNQ